jgi:hypothetical protein
MSDHQPRPDAALREALLDVVTAAWELNATAPDVGDGDPLDDLDEAVVALADRLGLPPNALPDELRAALAATTPAAALGALAARLRDSETRAS